MGWKTSILFITLMAASGAMGQNLEPASPTAPAVTLLDEPLAPGTPPAQPETNVCAGCSRPSFWQRCKQKLQAHFTGYAEEFQAPPLGTFLYLHGRTEVANGDAARMVLYAYDFEAGGSRLNRRGQDELAQMALMLPRNFNPVVVEGRPDDPLAQARRIVVIRELAHGSFPVPPERVVVGRPLASGLRGFEAEVIYKGQEKQINESGLPLPPTLGTSTAGRIQ
jgi:hypothetical protein